ncbi:hypothetical protein AB3662_43670 [Sorangium cellulosum]|uniref:hypothetical protein n=1 Tax=Sorangium cellulosum TaxID=56 RepID=UPI003D9AAF42
MVLTTVQHAIDAVVYRTPWRLHIALLSVPPIAVLLSASAVHRRRAGAPAGRAALRAAGQRPLRDHGCLQVVPAWVAAAALARRLLGRRRTARAGCAVAAAPSHRIGSSR